MNELGCNFSRCLRRELAPQEFLEHFLRGAPPWGCVRVRVCYLPAVLLVLVEFFAWALPEARPRHRHVDVYRKYVGLHDVHGLPKLTTVGRGHPAGPDP